MKTTMIVILTAIMLLSLAATAWDFSFIAGQSQMVMAADRDLPR